MPSMSVLKANTSENWSRIVKEIVDRLPTKSFFSKPEITDGLDKLEGASVRLNIKKAGDPSGQIVPLFTLGVENAQVILLDEFDGTPDVTMTGSIFDYLWLLDSQSRGEPISAGKIVLTGDLAIVQEIQNVINGLYFDPETWVASKLGDDCAHNVSKVVRLLGGRTEVLCSKLENDWSEYLKSELKVVPRKQEVEEFRNAAFQLEDDLDRLDARIKNLNALNRSR